jgi:hypothetical protein
MKCREFEERLNRLLDLRRAAEADETLSDHAASCDACRQLLIGQRALLAGLGAGAVPPLPADFSRRVVSRFQAEPIEALVIDSGSAARRAWQLAGLVAATAAAVMIAVSVFIASRPDSGPKVARNFQRGGNAASKQPGRSRGSLAFDQPSAPRRGASRAPARGGLLFLARPQGGYSEAIADMASQLPEAVERIEQVERYAPGIRPIRISFAMLWEALWRALPGMHSEEDPSARMHRPGIRGIV